MEVQIQETTVVRPLKPPFNEDHILSLSHIDTDRNLLLTLRYLRVYSPTLHHQNHPFHVISAALSAALVPYYPFAGTLIPRQSDGRLVLHCRAGDGVPLTGAVARCPLTAIDFLGTDIDEYFTNQLAPDPHSNRPNDPIRPIQMQVTKFSCGGFVLGAAVHHAICDGMGATAFFNAMADIALGSGQVTVEPVWERVKFLGPRDPPRIEYPIQELLGLDRDFYPYNSSGKRVAKEYLNVKEEWLDQLKMLIYNESGLKCTTFEALGAFIWRARTKAGKVGADEKVTFAYSINIRKTVNPSLPPGYWGNGCVPMYVHMRAAQVVEQPIWKTVDLIKKSKAEVTNEYVSSFIDFQELHYKQGINGGRRVSGFTDWRHLGHSSLDFGWGAPTAVLPLSRRQLGSVEPCYFLPGKEGMIRVLVHLEEDLVLSFRQEMDCSFL